MSDLFDKERTARLTAKAFLDVGAVQIYTERPFIFTSGWASPVYIDCRRLISYPAVRRQVMDLAASCIRAEIGVDNFEAIAGAETGGIPFAAWISDALDVPMQYVRKTPKGFARNASVEGHMVSGQKTLLLDDLSSDGRSKVHFSKILRDTGAVVEHAFVLFYYDIFPQSQELLKNINLELHALATWKDVLAEAKESDKFEKSALAEVENFINDPIGWSKANGGVAEEARIVQPFSGSPARSKH